MGEDAELRAAIDESCRPPLTILLSSAVFWLLFGSLLALLASIKLHSPNVLAEQEWLTFGRVRPAHLNTMIYGWASMAGIAVLLWIQARLARVVLPFPRMLTALAWIWNAVVAGGTVAILSGYGTSVEWLEFPAPFAYALIVPFVLIGVVSAFVFSRRRTRHVYVSQWYLFGAVFWFPVLYVVANLLIHGGMVSGVAQSTTNWWFAHNVLGLWLTPIGLATIYYLLPKVLGRPIHSYTLSLLGFWSLALFYNWAGTHHLIGGPVPVWITTVGTVASMMMFIPVLSVAINQHMTLVGHFRRLRESPTLRFIVFGGMSYTLVSVQGSLQALRTVNETSHFTHYTIAHAHLGVYSFYTMTLFGAVYYIAPRLLNREWPSIGLIRVHFWATATGMAIYWIGLSIGGWIQGEMLNDASVPFLDIVRETIPYLISRSVSGTLMTIGHIAFAVHFWRLLRVKQPVRTGAALFGAVEARS